MQSPPDRRAPPNQFTEKPLAAHDVRSQGSANQVGEDQCAVGPSCSRGRALAGPGTDHPHYLSFVMIICLAPREARLKATLGRELLPSGPDRDAPLLRDLEALEQRNE